MQLLQKAAFNNKQEKQYGLELFFYKSVTLYLSYISVDFHVFASLNNENGQTKLLICTEEDIKLLEKYETFVTTYLPANLVLQVYYDASAIISNKLPLAMPREFKQIERLKNFHNKIIDQKPQDPEIVQIINDHFWEVY